MLITFKSVCVVSRDCRALPCIDDCTIDTIVNGDGRRVDESGRQGLGVHVGDRCGQTRGGGGEEEYCTLLHIDCTAGQKAILGHLFGGLCVLHVIFSKQGDAYDAFCSQSFGMARFEDD
jgi:hypothetical protein